MPEGARGRTYTAECHDVVQVVEWSPYEWSSHLLAISTASRVTVAACRFEEEAAEVDGLEFNNLRDFQHPSRVTAFAWSPQTSLLTIPKLLRFCTGGADYKLRLFSSDLKADDNVKVLDGHTDYINGVTFEPDKGEHLASVSDDHTCRIWDTEGNQTAFLSLGAPGMAVRWHNDDPMKLLVAEKKGIIRFYSVLTQQPIMSLDCGQAPLLSADWCPSNKLCVAAIAATDWFVFDSSQSSRPLDSQLAHGEGARACRWAKTHNSLLATIGSPRGQVRVFNVKANQVLLSVELSMCNGLTWHHRLPLLAVGGDKKVHFWLTDPV